MLVKYKDYLATYNTCGVVNINKDIFLFNYCIYNFEYSENNLLSNLDN